MTTLTDLELTNSTYSWQAHFGREILLIWPAQLLWPKPTRTMINIIYPMVLETIVILSIFFWIVINVNVLESSLKSSQICTLVELDKCIKINVHVDPNALFSKLFVLLERCEDATPFFMFELTPFSTSVFKNFQVRKTDKALLKHHLNTDVPESQPPTDTMFVRWWCFPPLSEEIQWCGYTVPELCVGQVWAIKHPFLLLQCRPVHKRPWTLAKSSSVF